VLTMMMSCDPEMMSCDPLESLVRPLRQIDVTFLAEWRPGYVNFRSFWRVAGPVLSPDFVVTRLQLRQESAFLVGGVCVSSSKMSNKYTPKNELQVESCGNDHRL
jgi:hypothetical protein